MYLMFVVLTQINKPLIQGFVLDHVRVTKVCVYVFKLNNDKLSMTVKLVVRITKALFG